MALPPPSGIYFFPEDDVPPPGDPIYDLQQGKPRFVGGADVNDFTAIPAGYSHQRATHTEAGYPPPVSPVRQQVFLPLVQVSYQCQILMTTARTTLTQIFYHPGNRPISKATYTFPLYANCSVVSFICRVGKSRVITGVVKPKEVAKQTYESATRSGKMAGLLEYNTPDVFTTSIGNIPAGVKVRVEIGYILELPHDAEVDGIKFTVPLSIAPRYGPPPPGAFGQNGPEVSVDKSLRMEIEVTMGEAIKSVGSPSHPTSVQLGQHGTGKGKVNNAEHDPKKALVTLSQTPAELMKDFVLLITTVTPHFISTPWALLETHPTIPRHQALKVTLVPRFKMPGTETPGKTEVIFLVDRSGSMSGTIPYVKSALRVFLKSLPLGCFFNIMSFGTRCTSLWECSRAYAEGTLRMASHHIETFDASYGGTELLPPLMQAFSQRRSEPGMSTEIMVLTDGEIWRLPELLECIQQMRNESDGAVRLFGLGVGERVSHALIQGIATAGGGYSQIVPSGGAGSGRSAESLEAKVVRMLNSALTDHIREYKLHILHEEGDEVDSEGEDEEGGDGPRAQVTPANPAPVQAGAPTRQSGRVNLFDPTAAPPQRSPTPPSPGASLGSTLGSGGDSGNRFTHLKKLQGPEITQTPFEIPPLFPYERSVVYLLISPTAKELKYAKFVTLSATTIVGDKLELSIPITRVERPGETVHQLAGRMLLRDLEDGKSWLHSGKYGALAGDSSKVQEYIQREGEEVGMRWSLVSKWTSFIGVEEEVLNEAPMPTLPPSQGKPSGLAEGRNSPPSIPRRSPGTSADSEDSIPINTPTTSDSDRIPLSGPDPTHSLFTSIGYKARRGVIKGFREMSGGVDPMGRLLESRETPGPEHPLWNNNAQSFNTNSYRKLTTNSYRKLTTNSYRKLTTNSYQQHERPAIWKETREESQVELGEEPMKVPMKVPMKEPVKGPMKVPMKVPMKGPMKVPMKVPMKEPVKGPMKVPMKEPVKGPVMPPMGVPVKEMGGLREQSGEELGEESGEEWEEESGEEWEESRKERREKPGKKRRSWWGKPLTGFYRAYKAHNPRPLRVVWNSRPLRAVWTKRNIFRRSAPSESQPEDPSGSIVTPALVAPPRTIISPTGLHPSVVGGGLLATVDNPATGEGGVFSEQPSMQTPNGMLAPPQTPAGSPISIHRLIAAQNFDGSFPVADEYVAELLGSLNDPMPQACGGDKVAWVALLIAVLLERKYACLRDIWELVVRKIWVFLNSREGVKVEEVKLAAEELVAGLE